jgi:hypothetical protein
MSVVIVAKILGLATYWIPCLQLCDCDVDRLCDGLTDVDALYRINLARVPDAQVATGGKVTAVSSKIVVRKQPRCSKTMRLGNLVAVISSWDAVLLASTRNGCRSRYFWLIESTRRNVCPCADRRTVARAASKCSKDSRLPHSWRFWTHKLRGTSILAHNNRTI